jgi:NhaA family Na+:H+ antiporter
MAAAATAMVLANTSWAPAYYHLWEISLRIGIGDLIIDKTIHHWINDGLMAIFFFLVGLEIKREFLVGELASLRKATLPIAAALGGMMVPAILYTLFNAGGMGQAGWGIPMATDIAFALGALALLGSSVPIALVVFLTALAIADDLGAVLVIALFYAEEIDLFPLVTGSAILLLSYMFNRMGVRKLMVYIILGIILWVAFLKSGVHATVAGVLLAMTIPANALITENQFAQRIQKLIQKFLSRERADHPLERTEDQQVIIQEIELSCRRVGAPLQRIEHGLHPWVTYVIMPIFAFANAGVEIPFQTMGNMLDQPVILGIIAGLFLGKQAGIMLFSWLAVRSGWADLPSEVTWKQLYGTSVLAGIGFTMSLFIASLAFPDPDLLAQSKIGVLMASILSGVIGYSMLRKFLKVEN